MYQKIQKTKTTKRKFYGKWLYKVSINAPGIAFLRSKSLEEAIEFLKKPVPNTSYRQSLLIKAHTNSESLLKLCNFLKNVPEEDWTKRIETHQLDFYTNNKSLYDKFCNKFKGIVIQQFEPEETDLELLKNQYIIIVKKLPHNKYRYKAFLRPHKMKGDVDAKKRYLDWIDMQGDKICMSTVVKAWFMYTDWNWDRRYLLVEDTPTLLMLQMRSGDAVGKVYEYAVVDK
jgi:hypothetical protein